MLYETRVLSVSIASPWRRVYDFMRDPANLPQWASGLASGVFEQAGEWLADSPVGTVTVKMADENPFGVLDHDVTLPSGQVVYNALRVVPNANGSEVVFIVFCTEDLDAAGFAEACAHVGRDLQALKALMEFPS